MKLYTIGFTKKDARTFFELLRSHGVKKVLDIRLNNVSQLAGFAKGHDLQYFLDSILGVGYAHDTRFAPTKDLLDRYKQNKVNWSAYETEFNNLLGKRNCIDVIRGEYAGDLDGLCLLCSEEKASNCHRRLVAEYIQREIEGVDLIHIE